MSKIAKKPIEIKEGVNIVFENNSVKVTGVKGELNFLVPQGVGIKIEDGKLQVSQKDPNNEGHKALSGLTRALIANMVKGVTEGFVKKLEMTGVGYRAQASGNTITLSVGYSHPVIIKGKEGITFEVDENTISVAGTDKTLVGETAAEIRSVRPPEPYKGKGIRYQGERVRRKAGKAAKAVGGTAK